MYSHMPRDIIYQMGPGLLVDLFLHKAEFLVTVIIEMYPEICSNHFHFILRNMQLDNIYDNIYLTFIGSW